MPLVQKARETTQHQWMSQCPTATTGNARAISGHHRLVGWAKMPAEMQIHVGAAAVGSELSIDLQCKYQTPALVDVDASVPVWAGTCMYMYEYLLDTNSQSRATSHKSGVACGPELYMLSRNIPLMLIIVYQWHDPVP